MKLQRKISPRTPKVFLTEIITVEWEPNQHLHHVMSSKLQYFAKRQQFIFKVSLASTTAESHPMAKLLVISPSHGI